MRHTKQTSLLKWHSFTLYTCDFHPFKHDVETCLYNYWVLFNSTVTVWTLQTLVVVVTAVEQKLGFDGFEPNAIDRGSHLRLSSWHACHCGSLMVTKVHRQPWFYSMYCSKLRSGAPLCFKEVEVFRWFRKLKQKMMATMKTRGVWRRRNMHRLKNIHCCHRLWRSMFSYAKQWRCRLRALVLLCATQALNSNRFMVGDRDDPNNLYNKYTPGLFIRGFHDVFFKCLINGGFYICKMWGEI